jgi:hypothetical protein
MTYEEIKALAKQHFNLVEVEAESTEVTEQFATATLEDGTKVTNDKGSEFAVGDKVFVEVDGEKKDAPEGDHITESGMTITLDADSIITGMKRPDEAGEGSEGLAEEMPIEEEMSAETVTEEVTEEAFEEDATEEKMELEDVIKVIGEVVEEKMGKIEDKMKDMEDKMKSMEEKMSAFASEPAEESVVSSNFSKAKEVPALQDKRYFAMLEKLQTLNK